MGILGHQRPKTAPKIRIEKVVVTTTTSRPRLAPPRPSTSPSDSPSSTTTGSTSRRARESPASASPASTARTASVLSSSLGISRKRKAAPVPATRRARAAGTPPVGRGARIDFGADSGSEDGDDGADDEDWLGRWGGSKKMRHGRGMDAKRTLRDRGAFREGGDGVGFIHAREVASLEKGCKALFNAADDEVGIEVQYPSLLPRERFELVSGKDMIDAVDSSLRIVRHVAETYLPPDQAAALTDPRTGIIRRLEKESNRNVENLAGFKAALREYNELLEGLVRSGTVARVLDTRTELLPRELVAFVLEQVYDRTVAPEVGRLAKYENGSDNVYGELLHPLVSRILVEELGIKSDQVFVDLGSGVGNVVLQAALEVGCESWGCEMMDNACDLAEKQHAEFAARCILWGVRPGKVALERGDFRTNDAIHAALKRADAVLVNNQAFTSQLNDALVSMFLDLKPGCKVVSLKSFVRSSAHNINDVASSILDVQELTYPEGGQVSWTNAGGSFCISTKR